MKRQLKINAPIILLFGFLLLFQTAAAIAAPGDLDTTFGGTGKLRVGVGGGEDYVNAMARQADGKLVVAGRSKDISGFKYFSLVRYNVNGTPDTSFGSGGKVQTHIGSEDSEANAVTILSDGKILAAGYTYSAGFFDFAIAKYLSNGILDPTFGFAGVVTTRITGHDGAKAVAVQSDGKIILAGFVRRDNIIGTANTALLRYNANGTLDTTFDGDGIVITQIKENSYANAIVILGGRIYLAGNTFTNNIDSEGYLACYNSNGSLNTAFDGNGIVSLTDSSTNTYARALAVLAVFAGEEKIVVAGYTGASYDTYQTLWSYDANNGSVDTSFGGGRVTSSVVGTKGNAVRIQNSSGVASRVIVGGTSHGDFMAARYLLNGTLDTSFSGDGIATATIGASINSEGNAMLIQPSDNRIVVAGSDSNSNGDFVLVRFTTGGALDTSFDGDGIRIDDVGDVAASARATAVQADGKIVVAGDFAVARFNTDGSFDTSFDADGKARVNRDTKAMAIQTDGKIVLVSNSASFYAVARLNTDGSRDTSFGSQGSVSVSSSNIVINAVAVQTDGSIVIAGYTNTNNFYVLRLLPNGSRDASFGSNGEVTTDFFAGADHGYAVAVQADNKIVVAGEGAGGNFALVRYNIDGSLDTTFSFDGKQITSFGNSSYGRAMVIQAGKIIVAGYASNGSNNDFAAARYNISDGSLDVSFDGDGKLTTPIGTLNDVGNALAIQTDGKILISGSTETSANVTDFAVVRYNTNGSLDNSYGGGKVLVDVSSGNDTGNAIALDANGKAVIAGGADNLFGVARLLGDAPIAPTYEADVQSRPNGNGVVDSDDIQQIRRFSVGLDKPYQGNEGQRADCSPLSTSGNGVIDSDDIQQVRRFSVGLDGGIPFASGPISVARPIFDDASPFADNQPEFTSEYNSAGGGALRIGNAANNFGRRVTVPIYIDSSGAETGYTFSLDYDGAKLTNPAVSIGTAGGNVIVNTADAGVIGFSVTSFASADGTIAALADATLVNVTFTVATDAGAGATNLIFSDGAAHRRVSGIDPNAPLVQPTYADGTITITTPTPTWTSLAGRVVTPTGRGLMNVTVTLTDANGNTRATRTNSFGYYRFDNIEVGESYIFNARSKHFQFSSQSITAGEEINNLDFIAER